MTEEKVEYMRDRLRHMSADQKRRYYAYRQALWDAVDKKQPVSVRALAKKYKQL